MLKLYFFQTNRKWFNILNKKGYTISKYQKYIQYDLKEHKFQNDFLSEIEKDRENKERG